MLDGVVGPPSRRESWSGGRRLRCVCSGPDFAGADQLNSNSGLPGMAASTSPIKVALGSS